MTNEKVGGRQGNARVKRKNYIEACGCVRRVGVQERAKTKGMCGVWSSQGREIGGKTAA